MSGNSGKGLDAVMMTLGFDIRDAGLLCAGFVDLMDSLLVFITSFSFFYYYHKLPHNDVVIWPTHLTRR